ncbi:MAG: NAD-dependent epimerase/dehydratase family protein [Cyclobacteriaceae bacterium]
MQTVLGAGGAIGIQLAKSLKTYTDDIRLVGRKPQKVNDGDLLFSADLTDYSAVKKAVKDSQVSYLTAGLLYNTKVWEKDWPLIMRNVIDACLEHKCRLVFFDNIYMYTAGLPDPITENTAIDPSSNKGKVRAKIAAMIFDAGSQRGLQALIARSADFYGPSVKQKSVLAETVIKPLSQGKTANWLVNDNYKHSFTYTVDAGKATALLGNTPSAFGEVWHLPTADNPPNGKQWVSLIASELGVAPKHRVVSKNLVWIMGLFIPVMKESYEMLYQFDKDYVFSSAKFEKNFGIKPTSYQDGVREIVKVDYN